MSLRLRPILMTTLAMVLGAVPLVIDRALDLKRGGKWWVIVGGMTVGTAFTLFVIPAVYTLFSKRFKQERFFLFKEKRDSS